MDHYDIAVIGGGINGCAIARDAVGRGLKVLLVEKDDLGAGTSSASSKLIHGGLRYLEHYEFKMVREALREREILWALAPHLIQPLRFVLPHHGGLRPAWLIRLGLFLYDNIGGRKRLAASRGIDLRRDPAGASLRADFVKGFEYADCRVDDARLVVLLALDAAQRGAAVHPRTELSAAARDADGWRLTLKDVRSGGIKTACTSLLVNASGPWIDTVLTTRLPKTAHARARLVKGSHIVVPRIAPADVAYILQNTDGRVVFVLPFERDYSLIGTTDVDYVGRPEDAAPDASEITYLCDAVGDYFAKPVSPNDVVWSFAGIRPLIDDGTGSAQEATRDYRLDVDADVPGAVLLNVFGGKITTHRHLAEDALAQLKPWLATDSGPWTKNAPLPGGDFPVTGLDTLTVLLKDRYPALPAPLIERCARAYGTRTPDVLGDARTLEDLGPGYGATLFQREVDYLCASEWAISADDILWRRTKLGLKVDAAGVAALRAALGEEQGPVNGQGEAS